MIDGENPSDWEDLQFRVARILTECGLAATIERQIPLARGNVVVDVFAQDSTAHPPAVYLFECKHWKSAVSKDVIHAFRAVVVDSGAHRGFLISSGGFQSGAHAAAEFSNIDLLSWSEFQDLYADRWFSRFMAPAVGTAGDALHEYTEPINSRVARKARALPGSNLSRFTELRKRYGSTTMALFMTFVGGKPPVLPLRSTLGTHKAIHLPDEVLDAKALRPLLDALRDFYVSVTAEFDEVFGGRA